MAKLLHQILVVDIEATCWETKPPRGQESEIIEIGICVLDVRLRKRVEKRSILVKPEHSKVSPFCTKLTTLTQEEVDTGISFQEACRILKKEYGSKKRVWASYGDYDRRKFDAPPAQFHGIHSTFIYSYCRKEWILSRRRKNAFRPPGDHISL